MNCTLPSSLENPQFGGGQARGLRELVARRASVIEPPQSPPRGCHSIVISGGKGGVGRSVIALNLAITFAQRGEAVGLVDACPDFGNVDFLANLNGYWNLSHVLQGCRQLDEVLRDGPAGIKVLSGAGCLAGGDTTRLPYFDQTLQQLGEFERKFDWLIIDASGGSSAATRDFAVAADDVLIVTTPESTAVAEAYATVKSLASATTSRLGLLVNQTDSSEQAQKILDQLQHASHAFLQVDLHRRGHVPRDAAVPISVNSRIPFAIQSPTCSAAVSLQMLTKRWTRLATSKGKSGYFNRLVQPGNDSLA